MKPDGGPAFGGTRVEVKQVWDNLPAQPVEISYSGMSLRDYFAAKALSHIITASQVPHMGINRAVCSAHYALPDTQVCANLAYLFADAMLAQRVKENA